MPNEIKKIELPPEQLPGAEKLIKMRGRVAKDVFKSAEKSLLLRQASLEKENRRPTSFERKRIQTELRLTTPLNRKARRKRANSRDTVPDQMRPHCPVPKREIELAFEDTPGATITENTSESTAD